MKKLQVCVEAPLTDCLIGDEIITADIDSGIYDDASNEMKLIPVKSIEEAVEAFKKPISDNCWGGSDFWFFESGSIYLDKEVVARIAFNGKVFNTIGKDLRDTQSHTQILPEEFDTFITSLVS